MSQTPRYRFGAYDRLVIKGVEYRCIHSDSRGHDLKRTSSDGLVESFTHEQIEALLRTADFRHDRDHWRESKAVARRRSGVESIAWLTDDEQAKILWKEAFVMAFMALEAFGSVVRTEPSTQEAMRRIAGEVALMDVAKCLGPGKRNAYSQIVTRTPPCARTLLEWVRLYERADCDPLVLRDRRDLSGNRGLRRTPEEEFLLRKIAARYADERAPSKAYIKRLAKVGFRRLNRTRTRKGLPPLKVPGKRAVERAIEQLDPFFVESARTGLKTAVRKRGPVLGGVDVVRPLQRVEIDEWQVDLVLFAIAIGVWESLTSEERRMIKGVRRWLSVAIDTASRCILAMWLVEAPSAASGLATLDMVVRDKGIWADAIGARSPWHMHGGVEMFVFDHGAAGISDEVRSAIAEMGATHHLPTLEDPRLRGIVERFFGTVSTQLMPHFTGRTFSNVVQKGDYPAEKRASLTVDEFCEAAVRYVVDIYHRSPHAALRGETPFDAWNRLVDKYGVIPPPDADRRRAIFGIRLERTITTRGVRVLGLQYTSPELEYHFLHHRDHEVQVRIDPQDIGRVSVRLGKAWRVVPIRPDLAELLGVSVETWIAAGRQLARRHAAAAEVSLPIALEAVAAIDAMSRAAMRRVRINATAPTQEEIDREEAAAFRIFEIGKGSEARETGGASDLFGDVIDVPSPEPPPPQPPKPQTPENDADDFTMED